MPLIERYFLIHKFISLPMQHFVFGISYEVSLFTYILEKRDEITLIIVEKKVPGVTATPINVKTKDTRR